MRRHDRGRNLQVVTILVVPLLFIILGSLGYAAWTDTVTTIANLSTSEYNIEILECWVQAYNGQGFQLIWQVGGKDVLFADEALFPGWTATTITKIHNKDLSQSWATEIDYTLYYLDALAPVWVECTENDLLTQFGIIYTSGFYLNPGPDSSWGTSDDMLMPEGYVLYPCNSVYNKQTLIFDAQDRPELSGMDFVVKAVITATYPEAP